MEPAHAAPGGRLVIRGRGFDPTGAHHHDVYFGDRRALISRISSDRLTAIVPEGAMPEVRVSVDGAASAPLPVSVASMLASSVHPVSNPVFDPEGSLYVTVSGARGEEVPVSVFRVDGDGDLEPYARGIVNASGLAWGPDGYLYVSSRHEGIVYRVGSERDVEPVADELGVATGIAFDRDGILYVGDRRGTIFRIEPNGEPRSFCRFEPSVAAYHLAFDPEGSLMVAAPSLSPTDPVYRVTPDGSVSVFATGFGRPSGLAFDREGALYVTEALVGDGGIERITPDGARERWVAASSLVGLAFDNDGGVVLAGASTLFHLHAGVDGLLRPGQGLL